MPRNEDAATTIGKGVGEFGSNVAFRVFVSLRISVINESWVLDCRFSSSEMGKGISMKPDTFECFNSFTFFRMPAIA